MASMSRGHAVIGSLLITHGSTETNYTKHRGYEEGHAENTVTVTVHGNTRWSHQ